MNEELKKKLGELGYSEDDVTKLENAGVTTEDDLRLLDFNDLKGAGLNLVKSKKLAAMYAPAPVAPAAVATPAAEAGAPVSDVVPDGKAPTANQMNSFAAQFGMDPTTVQMIMMSNMAAGTGLDFDFGSMIPIGQIVGSYSPKIRNMPYLFMGQIQRSLGDVPIVAINADGSVNPELTAQYVLSLQEGRDLAEDDIFYDDEAKPYQLVKVGVDAQSVYDADPLNSSKALQQNGMGSGRIHWGPVSLDVRQMVFLAVNETHELNPSDNGQVARLRDHINKDTTRMTLQGDYPLAYTLYNEKLRTGALPTLRVQIARSARRPEIMPRRRTRPEGGQPGPGSTFPEEKRW